MFPVVRIGPLKPTTNSGEREPPQAPGSGEQTPSTRRVRRAVSPPRVMSWTDGVSAAGSLRRRLPPASATVGFSRLAVNPHETIATMSAHGRAQLAGPVRFGWRRLGLLALAALAAAIVYLLHPGHPTDDTYAFLDWGRDLRHGYLPLLERRTFHPAPMAAGAVLSLFGSAAPTITVLLCLVGLVLAAVAAWRITGLLRLGWPAAVLASLLVLATPLLSMIALVAFINLPFATLIVWAVVFALQERRAEAWALLAVAGLTRPEGWAFLVAYGVLTWWHAGHPYAPRRWLPIIALALGPMAV